jgi:hypothetical protein
LNTCATDYIRSTSQVEYCFAACFSDNYFDNNVLDIDGVALTDWPDSSTKESSRHGMTLEELYRLKDARNEELVTLDEPPLIDMEVLSARLYTVCRLVP